MTIDTAKLRSIVSGFRGRFFYDAERGDLAYIAKACEAQECECERKTNSDGDRDCSLSVGDMDADIDDVGEPIAEMLNAVPALLDRCEAAEVEVADMRKGADDLVREFRKVSAALNDIGWPSANTLGTTRACDALRTLSADRDRLAAECERLRALVNRAADVLDSCVRRHGTGEGSIAGDELRAEAKGEGK